MAAGEIVSEPSFLGPEVSGGKGWLCLSLPPHLRRDLMANGLLRLRASPYSCMEIELSRPSPANGGCSSRFHREQCHGIALYAFEQQRTAM